jgi:transcriptional regulator with XRE-family HTH domain
MSRVRQNPALLSTTTIHEGKRGSGTHDDLSTALSVLSTRARLSHEALAEASGLGKDTVGRWIRGESVPSVAALKQVEEHLSCTLGECVDLSPERAARVLRRSSRRAQEIRRRPAGMSLPQYLAQLLAADYIASGPLRGQFAGLADRRVEVFYQEQGLEERPALKPSYFPTYWGLLGVRTVLSRQRDRYETITADAIRARFGAETWLRIPLPDYETAPTQPTSNLVRIRHTARAASILFLCERHVALASDIAWALVTDLSAIFDGGIAELLVGTRQPSIHASAAVLQAICFASECPDLASRQAFRSEAQSLIEQINAYLRAEWNENRWAFGAMPWQVSAPTMLVDIAPYIETELRAQVATALRGEILPSGRLRERELDRFDAPGAILDLRTAFAVAQDPGFLDDEPLNRAIERLLEMRWDDQPLRTSDMTFLAILEQSHQAHRGGMFTPHCR